MLPCHEKTRFPSGARARGALRMTRRLGSREPGGTKPSRAYHCPHCNGWHLTSQWDPL